MKYVLCLNIQPIYQNRVQFQITFQTCAKVGNFAFISPGAYCGMW